MKKDAYYFSHDANSRNDVKCIKLRRELGMSGYGIFWAIIEMLRETPDYRLKMENISDIAFDLHVKNDEIEKVVKGYGLFILDENYFFSDRLNKSMEDYNTLKNKLKESGRKGGLSSAQARLEVASSKAQALNVNVNKIKRNKNGFSPSADKFTQIGNGTIQDGMVF